MPDGGAEREPRRTVNAPGRLLYCGGRVGVDVTVRDVSPNGARIVAQRPLPATDTFELSYDGSVRRCAVVWSKEGVVGVRFVGTPR